MQESSTNFHNLKYNILFGLSCECNVNTTVFVTNIYIKDVNCEGTFPLGFLIVFSSETDASMLIHVYTQLEGKNKGDAIF